MARSEVFDMEKNISHYASEEDFRAAKFSKEIRAPKINNSIRNRSCIVIFPRGISESRLTRVSVEEMMSEQWGDLYSHVVKFGTINFARKWIFTPYLKAPAVGPEKNFFQNFRTLFLENFEIV